MTAHQPTAEQLAAGVIGVGSMGQHHARVYSELPEAELIGVTDVDREAADSVAAEYGTDALDRETLLGRADIEPTPMTPAASCSAVGWCAVIWLDGVTAPNAVVGWCRAETVRGGIPTTAARTGRCKVVLPDSNGPALSM